VRFTGIIPAVTTPFTDALEVDTDALATNVETLIAAGIEGIVVNGTMGEGGSLDREERRRTIATVVERAAGRIPVTVGVSAGATAIACAYAADARELGADAVMCLPPLLYAGDLDEIADFLNAVADAAQLPVMAYNNPPASGTDLGADEMLELLSRVDAIAAVKECSGDARRIAALVAAVGDRVDVLVGGDDWALEGLAAGAVGWVSGVAVVVPEECVRLVELVGAGDLAGARELYLRQLPLARFDMTPKLVQYFKAAMDELGTGRGGLSRPPRGPLKEAEQAQLRAALDLLRAAPAVS